MKLLRQLRERLGADSPHLADPIEYEVTDKGRLAVYAGGLMYFRDDRDGGPIASRVLGGRAEFAPIEEDGRMAWTLAPLGQASSN